ncbi:MAG: hypothetical protein OXC31_24565 [Spirochaetaceae bacterium]|nr:hypothetical protein [Spirochaetaceae bacterium]
MTGEPVECPNLDVQICNRETRTLPPTRVKMERARPTWLGGSRPRWMACNP